MLNTALYKCFFLSIFILCNAVLRDGLLTVLCNVIVVLQWLDKDGISIIIITQFTLL